MTDKWIGPRVLCGDSNPPPVGYEYVRRYADDVRLAAGSGTTVENENVAGYVAFRRDWMRRARTARREVQPRRRDGRQHGTRALRRRFGPCRPLPM